MPTTTDQTQRRFGGYDHNVYYNPSAGALTLIGSLEDDEPWEYDTLLALKDDVTGDIYAVHDSGCSCPTPFENVLSFEDMTKINSLDELKAFVKAHDHGQWRSEDRQKLYRQVRKALVS